MKSRHSGEIPLKHSSSKSYLAMVTFDIVSMSFSPMNGDRPEMLLLFHVCVFVGGGGRVGVAKSINMKCKSSAHKINKHIKKTQQGLIN